MCLLNMSQDLRVEPAEFTLRTFKPPSVTRDVSGITASALDTSAKTIRWRTRPRQPRKLQTNARVNRWSDGTMTIQIASNPIQHLHLVSKSLARRPDSIQGHNDGLSTANSHESPPQGNNEHYTYLAAPHENEGLMRHTNHITTSLTVQSTRQLDEALLSLKRGLTAASKVGQGEKERRLGIISINEDPENAKKRAEIAEKEKIKAQRRIQSQQERENRRAFDVFKRAGPRADHGEAGLTIGDLEGPPNGYRVKTRRNRARTSDISGDDDDGNESHQSDNLSDGEADFIVADDDEVLAHVPQTVESSNRDTSNPASGRDRDGTTNPRQQRRRIIEDDNED